MPESMETTLNDLIKKGLTSIVVQQATGEFERGIVLCMQEEGVNLEAAIAMGRELVEQEQAAYPTPEAHHAIIVQAQNQAADNVRARFRQMRELIALDDNGSSDPKPFDAEKTQAAREQLMAEMGLTSWN